MRQQRTQNNRGQLPVKTLAFAPPITWAIATVLATQVSIALQGVTGDVVVNGLPKFRIEPSGDFCVAAEWNGTVLLLTFPHDVTSNTTISLPQNDRAVGTTSGAFLAGGNSTWTATVPPDTVFVGGSSELNAAVNIYDGALASSFTLPSVSVPTTRTLVIPGTVAGDCTVSAGAFSDTVTPGSIAIYTFSGGVWARS